jgi:hypothetical protein
MASWASAGCGGCYGDRAGRSGQGERFEFTNGKISPKDAFWKIID